MEQTHTTYIFHSNAFIEGGYNGTELESALYAHNRMGYAFVVRAVDVAAVVESNMVQMDVTVEQVGIAPFYYPLSLRLTCDGYDFKLPGVDGLIDEGDKRTFTFVNVPGTHRCLSNVYISLDSRMELPGRPIKFAQGSGQVVVDVPFVWEAMSSVTNPSGWGELVRLTLVKDTEFGWQDAGSLHDGDILGTSSATLRIDADSRVNGVSLSSGPHFASYFSTDFLLGYNELRQHLLGNVGRKELRVFAFDMNRTVIGERIVSFEVVHSESFQGRSLADDRPTRAEEIVLSSLGKNGEAGSAHRSSLDLLHGFNTPATPTLLQVVAMERGDLEFSSENTVHFGEHKIPAQPESAVGVVTSSAFSGSFKSVGVMKTLVAGATALLTLLFAML